MRVVLTDLDIGLMARSEAHVEGLLRELAPGPRRPGRPASRCAPRSGVLQAADRRRPAAQRGEAPAGRRRRRGSPARRRRAAGARLDAESVRDFARALDEADRLSRLGRLLTGPAPRELSEVRQGYLHRVIATAQQLSRSAAEPGVLRHTVIRTVRPGQVLYVQQTP